MYFIDKELIQMDKKNTKTLRGKWAKHMNSQFIKEELSELIQTNKYSIEAVIKEMQLK